MLEGLIVLFEYIVKIFQSDAQFPPSLTNSMLPLTNSPPVGFALPLKELSAAVIMEMLQRPLYGFISAAFTQWPLEVSVPVSMVTSVCMTLH
jgi:hypothetical protein